jgi:LPXTG-motif cell wall-anchored protein
MKTQVRGAVCVAILCFATVGFAQQGTTQTGMPNQGTTISGSIVSVSNDVIVIRTDTGETMRFNRDASANVPSNLMAGNRVTVEYDRLAADNMRVTRIELDDDADARGTTTPGTTTPGTTTPGTSPGSATPGATTPGTSSPGSTVGERATTTPGTTTRGTTTGYDRLPQTASQLVMVAFAGLASLGGALALRARRRR